jgi:hypothetical protein
MEDLESARDRLWNYSWTFENERAQEAYGVESALAKELTFRQEIGYRTMIILVRDDLGY